MLALATLSTALFTYGVPLLDPGTISAENLQSALPGTALLAAVLVVHEGGHQWVRCSSASPSAEATVYPVASSRNTRMWRPL